MVLRNARGPQHHPSREQPSCQKPYPTPAPHKHRLLLSTKGSESFFFFFFFFVRVRRRGGGVLTCFSKLDKWRRGERIKFESETIVSNLWHDGWFMS